MAHAFFLPPPLFAHTIINRMQNMCSHMGPPSLHDLGMFFSIFCSPMGFRRESPGPAGGLPPTPTGGEASPQPTVDGGGGHHRPDTGLMRLVKLGIWEGMPRLFPS